MKNCDEVLAYLNGDEKDDEKDTAAFAHVEGCVGKCAEWIAELDRDLATAADRLEQHLPIMARDPRWKNAILNPDGGMQSLIAGLRIPTFNKRR